MPKKRGGKGKKQSAPDPEPEPEIETGWVCAECEQENDASDLFCIACEEPKPESVDPRYVGYKIGVITEADTVAGKNKLTKVQIDIGAEDSIQVVTNAPNAKEGNRIVVATVGAIVGETAVKKTSVGGVASFGMLCDCPMLGWKGGAAGVAALVPESFALGSAPPQSRPRMDQ